MDPPHRLVRARKPRYTGYLKLKELLWNYILINYFLLINWILIIINYLLGWNPEWSWKPSALSRWAASLWGSITPFSTKLHSISTGKVHIFWEGDRILKNHPLTFDCMYCSQKKGEDFSKFCGLLKLYEIYEKIWKKSKMWPRLS